MKKFLGYMARRHEELEKSFTDEQKETLEKFHDCWSEYINLAEAAIFEYAFKLGMQIAVDYIVSYSKNQICRIVLNFRGICDIIYKIIILIGLGLKIIMKTIWQLTYETKPGNDGVQTKKYKSFAEAKKDIANLHFSLYEGNPRGRHS